MKRTIQDLAVFGGRPDFRQPLHVGRPNIGDHDRLIARIRDMLDRKWLTNGGPLVQEFEARIAELAGVRHCIATCNATVALEIATRACGMAGEVIVPSFTFIATAHALQWQGITPVFCDIDPSTHNIDPAAIERMITPRTTGIVGVHLWGRPCDVDAIEAIARRRHLKLVFDAAHALGCSAGGRMVGSFGDAEVFSFHATKFVNAFEGGAVVTDDDELAARIRLMQNFGFDVHAYDDVIYIGTNGKMNEAAAAMGLTSLESIGDFIEVNRRNYEQYREGLDGLPGITVIRHDEHERRNYQYIVLEIDQVLADISRDELQRILRAEGVLARRYFFPGCHRMEPYRSYFPHSGTMLPETERLTARVLTLPTGGDVDPTMIQTICATIRMVIARAQEVTGRLRVPVPVRQAS
jgi:dTDP-4-amino-4,6-dideoxygalactose transaminase